MFSLFLPNTTKKLMLKEYKKGIKPQRDELGRCHRRQGMPALIDEQDGSAGVGGQCVAGTGQQKVIYCTEQVGGVSCGGAACKELWAASKMLPE